MKPIFVIGATMLAAGAAFGFAKAVDQLAAPQETATPMMGSAVERKIAPTAQADDIRKGVRPLTGDSSVQRELTDAPAAPAETIDIPQPEIARSETMTRPVSEPQEIAAVEQESQVEQPISYFVAPDAAEPTPGSPENFSEIGSPTRTSPERFESLPMIGVYR